MTLTKRLTRRSIALAASTTLALTGLAALPHQAAANEPLTWKSTTFGQSTDLNFSSNVLPEKVGTNLADPDVPGTIEGKIFMESRGGKIAPGHDGLTFYHVDLDPTVHNFVLSADVRVNQLGPETGANPNGQEGAGLMVRDLNGAPRQDPMIPGYEEYPAASNFASMMMLRNGPNAMVREGVTDPWGTLGSTRPAWAFASGGACNVVTGVPVRMTLERTNTAFEMSATWTGTDGSTCSGSRTYPGADLVQVQDADTMTVGFFASRNVAVTFSNASLTLSAANTVPSPPRPEPVRAFSFENLSAQHSSTVDYSVDFRSTHPGTLSVVANGEAVASNVAVDADAVASHPTTLRAGTNHLSATFVASEGPNRNPVTQNWTVEVRSFAQADLIAGPNGTASGDGTQASPLDVQTALNFVAPGHTVQLLGGTYALDNGLVIRPGYRGAEGAPKTLAPLGNAKVVLDGQLKSNISRVVMLEADHWVIRGLQVTRSSSNGLRVSGSHNLIDAMVFNFNRDSGFQLSGSGSDSARWPAHNLIRNSESHDNRDLSDINADGFAAKLGVGPGNVFRGNVSHHNIDDGWDLYNRLNEGANFPITLEGNIAHSNGFLSDGYNAEGGTGNGFKLGGEGLPVAHVVTGNLAYNNNMDGFSDNFNPGRMVVTNNTAVANGRYNVLFRSSPYFADADQSVLRNTLSLATPRRTPALADAAAADLDATSHLWNSERTVNSAGKEVRFNELVTLTGPRDYKRNADGAIVWGDFTRPRWNSFLASAGTNGTHIGALEPAAKPGKGNPNPPGQGR